MSVELLIFHTEDPQTLGALVRLVDVPHVSFDFALLRELRVAHGTHVASALVDMKVKVEPGSAVVAPPTQMTGQGHHLAMLHHHVMTHGRRRDAVLAHVACRHPFCLR